MPCKRQEGRYTGEKSVKIDSESYRKIAIVNARSISFVMGGLVLGLISFLDAIPRFDCIKNESDTFLVAGSILLTWMVSWMVLTEVGIRVFFLLMKWSMSDPKGAA